MARKVTVTQIGGPIGLGYRNSQYTTHNEVKEDSNLRGELIVSQTGVDWRPVGVEAENAIKVHWDRLIEWMES